MTRTFPLWIVLPGVWALLGAVLSHGQESWPRFRGADATGVVADDPRLSDTWDQTTGVQWKVEIPGRGWGSPIVWGDRVFVSAVHSDEEYEQPKGGLYLGQGRGEPPDTVHHWMVYCFSLNSGELAWKHQAHTGKPQIPRHPKSTYAAETPTTDGKRLYVLFGDVGLYAYDFQGKQLWAHAIEPKKTLYGYGAAASPVVCGDTVIMVYDNQEESYIAAIDSATGEIRWRVVRDETKTWATPLVWQHDGRTEIVTSGERENRSYSTDGKLLWHFNGQMSVLTIPSPFAVDGLLYITSGYFQDNKRPIFAIKPGADGDITLAEGETSNDFIQWSAEKMGPYNPSPIVYRGLYYTLLDRGMITCHDAKTGELVYDRTRFPQGATFTASPWAYNGKVFFLDEDGETYVMPAGREFKIERTNVLDELCLASPAIAQGKLLIRTASHVYCIAKDEAAKAEAGAPKEPDRGKIVVTDRARRIHDAAILVDGHNDLPWQIRDLGSSTFEKLDIAKPQPKLHTDIARLRAGGVKAQFWSVYVPASTRHDGKALSTTLEQIAIVKAMIARYPDTFELALTVDDIERICGAGKIASLVGVEGGHSIENSLSVLRQLYEQGTRYMTLTHSDTLDWADSATDDERHGGLTEFGKDVVREMNRLGMLVDLSHVSVATMKQAIELSKAPVIFSHSSARAIADHPRNVPDDVLRLTAQNGGVVMVNFFPGFIVPEAAKRSREGIPFYRELKKKYGQDSEKIRAEMRAWYLKNPTPPGTIHTVLDHIQHIARVAGVDHVGLGSDFDGITSVPQQLEDVSMYPNITQGLLDRGYSDDDIKKILGGNLLRVLRGAEKTAAELKQKSNDG